MQTNPLGDIPFSVFCGHRMLGSGMLAKMLEAARLSREKAKSVLSVQKFLSFGRQRHDFRHSVSTECADSQTEAAEFV